MSDVEHRALHVRAANAVAHTRSLAEREPSWGSEVHALAGGWLVLAGAGMYINQALAAGIDVDVTPADIDHLIERSEAIGVAPAFEVTASTAPNTIAEIRRRGFAHEANADITVLAGPESAADVEAPDDLIIRPVECDDDLRRWQDTSALGWGHTRDARRGSDAFAAAAHALDTEHFMVAFDAGDDRPVGCAAMTVNDGVAMLGGMSTIPANRRRGVQAAMVRYRLARARDLGCDLAVATAAAGGASERNLRRHGFEPIATVSIYRLAPTTAAGLAAAAPTVGQR